MHGKNIKKLQEIEEKYNKLSKFLTEPAIIQNPKLLQKYSREQKQIEGVMELWKKYKKLQEELENIKVMLQEEQGELRELAEEEKETIQEKIKQLEQKINLTLLPEDKFSHRNAVVEIRAGAGGEEAALFAADLYTMYTRFAEEKGWKIENIHFHPTDMGGFKEIIFVVEGRESFSILRYESGVHRVQRVPATESSGRIHTSTVTVAVLPEAEEIDEIEIKPEEMRIDTFHSRGAGGQHVNVTDSAIRITHTPTGIVVQCQDERSQHQNKAKALRVLRAELLQLKEEEQRQKISRERKTQIGRGERSERIRTYNFPQARVTDHRAGVTLYNLEEVLEGKLEQLILPVIKQLEEREIVSDKT
ncbi:peptide chain release factor 1 [Candidatus Aerophobetes bacterium]|nr:peptide chain release factor 1 [Candidatus Aerophobetes bacterium]